MPDKGEKPDKSERSDNSEKGWRKKIHSARPKTPLQSKAAVAALEEDTNERRRRQPTEKPGKTDKVGWRKTIHSTRPETPAGASASSKASPVDEDPEDARDARSEHGSETSTLTPHRRSALRPNFSRYLSGYLSLTTAPKESFFSEQWTENFPAPYAPTVDPLEALQSIHSHLCNHFSKPIPPEYHGGLLRIFEDYRKLRTKKENLVALLRDVLDGYQSAEESWAATQDGYEDEIRRLELIIARGASGMTGLMAARRDTVIKHTRPQRKTLAVDTLKVAYEYLSPEQLDVEIKTKSQKVLLRRPASPSGKMTALSRRFSSTGSLDNMPVGTPPRYDSKGTLSRKLKSELDLASLKDLGTSNSTSQSVYSDFSESGDPLPDEIVATNATILDAGVECEAFVALRDLGTLVARRRGINAKQFVNKLMLLFSTTSEEAQEIVETEQLGDEGDEETTKIYAPSSPREDKSDWTPNRRLRHFRSQPQLSSDHTRRRHFSFEPGDDQLEALEKDISAYETHDRSQPTPSPDLRGSQSDLKSEASLSRSQTLNAEPRKQSKIPSPVQGAVFGHVRREASISSLQSVSARPQLDDRRDSRSSIVTVIREPGGSFHAHSTSRSSSISNLRRQEAYHPKEHNASPVPRNSVFALAAARAADNASNSAESKSGSPARSRTRAGRTSSQVKSVENDATAKRS